MYLPPKSIEKNVNKEAGKKGRESTWTRHRTQGYLGGFSRLSRRYLRTTTAVSLMHSGTDFGIFWRGFEKFIGKGRRKLQMFFVYTISYIIDVA